MPKRLDDKTGLFYRIYAYFMHGHSAWMGFLTSIGTFLMVLFGFAFTYFLLIGEWLANPIIYLLISFPAYFVLATIVGRWSYYKGAFAARASIEWKQNPEYMEMKQDIKDIKEEVKELKISVNELKILVGEIYGFIERILHAEKQN